MLDPTTGSPVYTAGPPVYSPQPYQAAPNPGAIQQQIQQVAAQVQAQRVRHQAALQALIDLQRRNGPGMISPVPQTQPAFLGGAIHPFSPPASVFSPPGLPPLGAPRPYGR